MRRKGCLRAGAVILMALVFSASGVLTPAIAIDLALPNLDGEMVRLADYSGRVIILNFFATWCPPCKQEIPDFVELQKEYGGGRFTVIGVSLSGMSDTKTLARNFGINYPVLIENGKGAAAYGPIRSIPTTLILDQKLKVVKRYIGFTPKEVFEADIRALLR